MQNNDIYDISKCNLIASKLNIDVFKLFNKIKIQCIQSNPLTADGIMSHLFNCVKLFNNHKIDSLQLANSVKSLFGQNFPHLYYEFLNIMQRIQKETNQSENKSKIFKILNSYIATPELRKDLNFSSLNDCGPSYRLLPSDYKHKICSGRINNKICSECLNDNYICFPSMTSEDTSAVSSKKNPHEEHLHRLEDERYEVDMFQEINKYALKHLTDINKKMDSMSKEEKLKFQLDENIGGSSAILMRKAIYRIYGDATDNMIEGLKGRPKMAIPLVISRMQEKAKEWNQIHSKFKMVWEDRANKHYWQSLDYQGDWVKRDAVFLKRSTFFSQIESLSKGYLPFQEDFLTNHDFIYEMSSTKICLCYDHNIHMQYSHKGIYGNVSEVSGNHGTQVGPHLTLLFPADSDLFFNSTGVCIRDIIDNANNLIANQIHLQYNLSKEDKSLLIEYIFQIIGFFFDNPGAQVPQILIGSIREQKDRKSERYITSPVDRRLKHKRPNADDIDEQMHASVKKINHNDVEDMLISKPLKYNLMIGNSYIYTFIRLYHVLIDRLTVLKIHAIRMIQDDNESDDLSGNDDVCHDESDKYIKVLKLLDSSDSNSESTANIDSKIRELASTKAFLWFTIPRIVQQIVKTSQQLMCAGLESSKDLLDLYCQHSVIWPNGGGTGGLMTNRELYAPKEKKYVNDAIEFCINQGLLCFLMIFVRQQGRLLIELIDTDNMKVFNGTSNVYSELGSTPASPDHQSKPILEQDETTDCYLTSYEKYRNNSFSSYKPQNFKNQKITPLFLMKNLKKGIRALTSRSLEISKHESLRRSFPSMEEVAFMKLNQSRSKSDTKNSSIALNYLHAPLLELYRSALVGNGEIYNFLFEQNREINKKQGFLFKKPIFRKSNNRRKFKKMSIDEISLMINVNTEPYPN